MPILQGFPDFETVKFFTGKFFQKYNFTPVFYDIETTGLSRNSTYLYLIGAVGIEDETWNFYQWMAENASEEETILRIFSQFLQQYNLMISYNGERFDQPYLEARYEKYGIPSPFTGKQSLDLYLTLKPLKSLLKLSAMKQPCMEEFLGIKDRIYDNGKECIKLYKDFLKKRDAFTADEILGHNLESLNIPVVTIDNKIADKIPFVTVNGRSAISKAVCEIAESGYEKVIFVCPPLAEKNLENIYVHEERTAGFKEAVKKIHGLEYVIIGNWDYQKQAKKELEKSEKKTAFLCTGDMFALNLIRMFEKNGKRAGQDYGIMGYDNIDFLEYVTPRLTTIDNHVEKVAEEAFNLLLQLMENKNVAETERILETVTVQGETI